MMCVNPGWGGQTIHRRQPERIKAARALRDRINPKLDIEIDGGVNAETAAVRRETGPPSWGRQLRLQSPAGMKAAIQELR